MFDVVCSSNANNERKRDSNAAVKQVKYHLYLCVFMKYIKESMSSIWLFIGVLLLWSLIILNLILFFFFFAGFLVRFVFWSLYSKYHLFGIEWGIYKRAIWYLLMWTLPYFIFFSSTHSHLNTFFYFVFDFMCLYCFWFIRSLNDNMITIRIRLHLTNFFVITIQTHYDGKYLFFF